MGEPLTKGELRMRIDSNLKEIEESQEAAIRWQADMRELRRKETDLINRMTALRDQVKKDLTALDSELTS